MRTLLFLLIITNINIIHANPVAQKDEAAKGSDKMQQLLLLKQQMEAEYEYKYTGFIATYPIHFWFKTTGGYDCPRGGSTFEGFYYYDKNGSSNRLLLKGYSCGASIYFTEYNENGTTTGNFSGIWGGDEIHGSWNSGAKELEFKLLAEGSKAEPVNVQTNNAPAPGAPVVKDVYEEKSASNLPVTYNGAGNRETSTNEAQTEPRDIGTPSKEAQTEPRDIGSPDDQSSASSQLVSMWRYLKVLYARYPQEAHGIAAMVVLFFVLIIILNQKKQNALLKKQNEMLEKRDRKN